MLCVWDDAGCGAQASRGDVHEIHDIRKAHNIRKLCDARKVLCGGLVLITVAVVGSDAVRANGSCRSEMLEWKDVEYGLTRWCLAQ